MKYKITPYKFTAKDKKDAIYSLGALAGVILLGVLIWLFVSISHTDMIELYLGDNPKQSHNWQYEVLSGDPANSTVTQTTPTYADEHQQVFEQEQIHAIRILRTMTEDIDSAKLKFSVQQSGVQIYLDDKLLYTDFPGAATAENGFLTLADGDFTSILEEEFAREISLSLPQNYTGKQLSITTYYPSTAESHFVVFPFISTEQRQASNYVVGAVTPILMICISALFVVILGIIFLLSAREGQVLWEVLLLMALYIMLMLSAAAESTLGAYSKLVSWLNPQALFLLYVVPLLLYIAIKLSSWRRKSLLLMATLELIAGISFALYNGGNESFIYTILPGITVFIALVLTITMIVFEYRKNPAPLKKYAKFRYAIISGVAICAVALVNSAGFDSVTSYIKALVKSILSLEFRPISNLIATASAIVVTVILITEFAKSTIKNREMISVIEARSEQALTSYQNMKSAAERTRAAQHELKHHVLSLAGMLNRGEDAKALEYLNAINTSIASLPSAGYSENILVDMVAGNYLERAKSYGISVEHYLPLPPHLGIKDKDLCVMLTNMLENAFEACLALPETSPRLINLQVWVNGRNLMFSCKNSIAKLPSVDEKGRYKSSKLDSPNHGYGIPAMREIAEKYNSTIDIETSPTEFSIKTSLLLL